MDNNDLQTTPGRLSPCCVELKWALSCGYIRKGYMWDVGGQRRWIPWSFDIQGVGFLEQSPISFCPFCGKALDTPDDS